MSKNKWEHGTCQDYLAANIAGMKAMTAKQIASEIGYSYPSVLEAIKKLKAAGKVRISGWIWTDGCHLSPLFSAGNEQDVERPPVKKKSKSERMKAWRARRLMSEDELLEIALERERINKIAEARCWAIQRHPQDVALFGEYQKAA